MAASANELIASVEKGFLRTDVPDFRPGDAVRVHAKIVEGTKERVQIFEGVVIRRHLDKQHSATFTVRKISYNIGVERTFLINSPRIEKIEVVTRGDVRRARLFYLRDLRGKSAKIKNRVDYTGPLSSLAPQEEQTEVETSVDAPKTEVAATETAPVTKKKKAKK